MKKPEIVQKKTKALSFIEWVQRTLSDGEGIPSFNRQLSLLLFVLFSVALFLEVDATYLEMILWTIFGLLGITGGKEVFTRKI